MPAKITKQNRPPSPKQTPQQKPEPYPTGEKAFHGPAHSFSLSFTALPTRCTGYLFGLVRLCLTPCPEVSVPPQSWRGFFPCVRGRALWPFGRHSASLLGWLPPHLVGLVILIDLVPSCCFSFARAHSLSLFEEVLDFVGEPPHMYAQLLLHLWVETPPYTHKLVCVASLLRSRSVMLQVPMVVSLVCGFQGSPRIGILEESPLVRHHAPVDPVVQRVWFM